MRKRLKFRRSLLATLALGWLGCANSPVGIPDLGAPFVDMERDEAGTDQRLAEFEVVCVAPTRKDPPEPAMAPAWCAWTQQADRTIRANNAKAGGLDGAD